MKDFYLGDRWASYMHSVGTHGAFNGRAASRSNAAKNRLEAIMSPGLFAQNPKPLLRHLFKVGKCITHILDPFCAVILP